MKAPRIVAKGQRLMADRIKQLARESNVPIIEDKPLARALFPRPIGAEVPAHLYRAVAKLLVLVHQARFNRSAGYRQAGAAGNTGAWAPGRGRAAGGMAASPWWNGAAAGGTAADGGAADGAPSRGFSGGVDGATAARLYGGAAAGEEIDVDAMTAELDEAWLNESVDEIDGVDVDEDALAQAMDDDELGEMTPEELAELEAGLGRNAADQGAEETDR
jgi:type III secretion system FlhB-like substrate exporter